MVMGCDKKRNYNTKVIQKEPLNEEGVTEEHKCVCVNMTSKSAFPSQTQACTCISATWRLEGEGALEARSLRPA
jgi:hypothetical protein